MAAARPASAAASVIAVGRPAATSCAKVGPDSTACGRCGARSRAMSIGKAKLPASIPLLQKISGASPTGSSARTARRNGTGTTISSASRSAKSARLPVAVSDADSAAPGRKTGLRWSALIAATTSSSRAHSRTGAPSAASIWASAVPHAPPPTTPNRVKRDVMLSLQRRAPLRRRDRVASAAALRPTDCR